MSIFMSTLGGRPSLEEAPSGNFLLATTSDTKVDSLITLTCV